MKIQLGAALFYGMIAVWVLSQSTKDLGFLIFLTGLAFLIMVLYFGFGHRTITVKPTNPLKDIRHSDPATAEADRSTLYWQRRYQEKKRREAGE